MTPSLPLVVFSHLRWDFVYQRPQHVLSRLSRHRRIFVVEEPVHADAPGWERSEPAENLTVLRPRTPVHAPGFATEQLAVLSPMLRQLLRTEGVDACAAWLYTPLALPLALGLDAEVLVYDCMDELSLFEHAPPHLLTYERTLLERADLVLTGGPSLYRAKKDRNPNVHCFPSSVEAAHYAQARPDAATPLAEPADQAAIPHPRLGYFGVIDERMDLAVLEALADAHPEWHVVLVGPVVKIDPASLPQRPNLHFLGPKTYAELPAYLAGWDVCLLPFALNDATRFISPTKTLEYMAAERPIVSTPITDVAEPYGDVVYLGSGADGFVAACERAMTDGAAERARRTEGFRAVLAQTSWDATAARMGRLLDEALATTQNAVAA